VNFNSEIWKTKKENGKSLRDEISIKIPNELQRYKRDLIAMHNII